MPLAEPRSEVQSQAQFADLCRPHVESHRPRTGDDLGGAASPQGHPVLHRIANHIARQREAHRLRHVVNELVKYVPDDIRSSALVRDLAAHGCTTRMHFVRLLAPRLENESHIKDIDFSPSGIRERWQAG
jgi:hypothetical protein